MFITNRVKLVDKVWSKYLLDTLDLSLRKNLLCHNNNYKVVRHSYNTLTNGNIPKPNLLFIIIYGVSCFFAGYYTNK